MLDFVREGNTLKLVLRYVIPYGGSWKTEFQNSFDGEHPAQTAYSVMRDALEQRIREIRREAYEAGWKDRGSKRPKQNWFSIYL